MGKAEIVQAAETLFSERGYDATSMRDIADRVGVKAASLYSHIANKQELLYIIVNTASDRFLSAIRPLAESVADPEVRLGQVIHRHLTLMVEQLDVATVFLHERGGLNQAQREEVLAKRREYESALVHIIDEGVASGAFETADTRLAARSILSMLNWTYTWYRPDRSPPLEDVADFMTHFATKALHRTGDRGVTRRPRQHDEVMMP